MRTGQKVRVQDGTGPGSGGGRRGQTVHVRAPGGGGLFEHGVVLAKTNAYNNFAFDAEALWDTDGYFDPDGDVGVGGIAIPAGLGGVYLLQANWPYSKASAPTSGWWKMAFQRNGTDELGQWQQGYRALAELRSAGSMVNLVWVGVLADGDTIGFAITGYGDSVGTLGAGAQFSAFRLGAVGETGFHGALIYRTDQSYLGNDQPAIAGAALFDTDDYATSFVDLDDNGLEVPSGLGGLYIFCTAWTWQVKRIAGFVPELPNFPYGFDWALIPHLSDDLDSSYFQYPAQTDIGAADINDIGENASIGATALWVGRLDAGSFVASVAIPDLLGRIVGRTQCWLHETDAALSYAALVRIAE